MKCPPHIQFVCDDDPAFKRKKKGRRFIYIDPGTGLEVNNPEINQRIDKLVIPPMWKNVWISQNPNGHIQATGLDLRKRKQYIYHPEWVDYRQQSKFDRLELFGELLPRLRRKVDYHINKKGYGREKILAISIRLLDTYYLRIGNERYETENNTFGLTTLRRKHLIEENGHIRLCYKAKSGKIQNITIKNRKLEKLLININELPGYEVFRYQENGKLVSLDSREVNEFIGELMEESFTAKDFRTWAGTIKAIEHFPAALREISEYPRKKLEPALIRRVARELNNTVAICRQYYIHPAVLDTLISGKMHIYEAKLQKNPIEERFLRSNEKLALTILKNQSRK